MSKYDWEACERDYRAGQLSIRHIATKHGIPESTVRSKAQALGWQRDLTDDVRTATKAKLSRTSRSKTAQEDDAQIIDQASNDAAAIIEAHRKAIAQWRSISDRLAKALASVEITEDNHDRVARSLNSSVDALLKAIKAERQVYGLDDDKRDEVPPERHLSDEKLHDRIRELAKKLGYA